MRQKCTRTKSRTALEPFSRIADCSVVRLRRGASPRSVPRSSRAPLLAQSPSATRLAVPCRIRLPKLKPFHHHRCRKRRKDLRRLPRQAQNVPRSPASGWSSQSEKSLSEPVAPLLVPFQSSLREHRRQTAYRQEPPCPTIRSQRLAPRRDSGATAQN